MTRILRSKRTWVVIGVVVLLMMVGLDGGNTKKERDLIAIAEKLLAEQYPSDIVESITFSSVEVTEVEPSSVIVEGFADWVCPSPKFATHQKYEMIVQLSKVENEWTIMRVQRRSHESVWHRIVEEIGQLLP